ncbi:hypothetical protein VI26_03795 [Chromobacterium sp. LK1]|uniref:hypothetical protein n=1 Tax=Chromobacterium sp. LK1 TaxID=1628193 RepID=UPI000652A921|nr:hypothetical protein [Chromobacterium sp. LK1]KMN37523.1 hypothetical protein VI26_03795 [Chromobacterium sp. LK1]
MSGFIISMIIVPLLCSLLCWWLLAAPLRQVTQALCEHGSGGPFWQRAFLILILAGPLLAVLLLAPDAPSSSLWQDIRGILMWALLGVVAQLLVLLRLVWQQVAPRPSAHQVQAAPAAPREAAQ